MFWKRAKKEENEHDLLTRLANNTGDIAAELNMLNALLSSHMVIADVDEDTKVDPPDDSEWSNPEQDNRS